MLKPRRRSYDTLHCHCNLVSLLVYFLQSMSYYLDRNNSCTFTSGEKCRLQTTYSTCGSTIKLTGDCEYQSDILAKCQYSIVTASSEGQIQAVLTTRGRRSLVSRGKTIEECIKVTNEGTFISISDDVCQRCTVDYLRSLIPNQTCKGTWKETQHLQRIDSISFLFKVRGLQARFFVCQSLKTTETSFNTKTNFMYIRKSIA